MPIIKALSYGVFVYAPWFQEVFKMERLKTHFENIIYQNGFMYIVMLSRILFRYVFEKVSDAAVLSQ